MLVQGALDLPGLFPHLLIGECFYSTVVAAEATAFSEQRSHLSVASFLPVQSPANASKSHVVLAQHIYHKYTSVNLI